MSKKLFSKVFILLLVVGLLFAVAPTKQAMAQTPTTLNVAQWSATVPVGLPGRPSVLLDGTTYHMWYGNDAGSTTTLYHTTSADPATFGTGTEVIFTGSILPAERSSVTVIKEGSTYYLITYGTTNQVFAVYTSTDGVNFVYSKDVLNAPAGSQKFDTPALLNDGTGSYKLYYQVKEAKDGTLDPYQIYVATASVVDGPYTQSGLAISAANPARAHQPTVVKDGSTYYMWYTGFNQTTLNFATSIDGLTWTKAANPVLSGVAFSEPLVIKVGSTWHLFYTGASNAIQHVSATGPFEFQTIQAAITAANAGDVINVAAGTYKESLVINKALTLTGAGRDVTIIDGTGLTAGTLVSAPNLTSGVLSISGFTFKDDPTPTAALTYPVSIGNCQSPATASFTDNTIIGTGTSNDWGLLVQGGNCSHTIKNNLFDNVGGNSILIERATGNVEIGYNTFLVPAGNEAPAIWSMSYGTELDPHTVTGLHWYHHNTIQAKVDGGIIRGGIGFAPAFGEYAWNLRQYGSYENVLVEYNTIEDFNSSGIQVEVDGANSTFNGVIQNNTLTPAPSQPNSNGIRLLGPVDDTSLLNNIVTGAQRGIYLSGTWSQPIYPTDITIEKNQLAGNVSGLVEIDTALDQDASPNWWGSVTGPAAGSIIGTVKYLPYCTDAGCTKFSEAKLSMDPATIDALTCGPQYVDVMVTDVADLTGYTLVVNFDKTKVHVDSVVNGGFLHETDNSIVVESIEDDGNTTGKLIIHAYLQAKPGYSGDPDPVSGSGSLIRINFTPLLGTTTFDVDESNSLLVGWPEVNPMPFSVTGRATATLTGGVVRNTNTGTNYCSLASAVADAGAGHKLQLLTDLTIPAMIPVNKALTLDLNGKVATGSTGINALNVTTGGALNITDSGTTGKITGGTRAVMVNGGGSLTLTNGWLDGTGFDGVFVYGEGSSVTVNGGTITGLYYGISGNGSASPSPYFGTTTILITGGTVQGGETAIFHPQLGPLTINGGEIIGGTYNGIEMKAGDLTITGGTITTSADFVGTPAQTSDGNTQSGDAILIYNRAGSYPGTMTVNITGGTITSTNGYALREYTYEGESSRTTLVNISGGHFTGGASGAVYFATNDIDTMELVGGDYSADPLAYVYTPYTTYQFGSRWYITKSPTITSKVDQGYYLAGEEKAFDVTMNLPAGGIDLALMIFDYKLAGVTTADITKFEFFAQDLNEWIVLGSRPYETYANCTNNTGICGQFGWAPGGFGPIAAGFTNTTQFRVTFAKGFTAPLSFTLDLSGKLAATDTAWTSLTTYTGLLDVYDKATVTIGNVDPYFLVDEPGAFNVTVSNPTTGRYYNNTVVFDVEITPPTGGGISALVCTSVAPMPVHTWTFDSTDFTVNSVTGKITARLGGEDDYFIVPNLGIDGVVNCTATFTKEGTYSTSGNMVDVVSTAPVVERIVSNAVSASVDVYRAPEISAVFPAGPYLAGVPVTIPITITNPDGLTDPFKLQVVLSDGTTLTFVVDPAGYPTTQNIVITFEPDQSGDVVLNLYDDTTLMNGRLLDTATQTGVVVNSGFTVTGNFSMQGNLSRAGVPVTFTWTGDLVSYGPTGYSTAVSGTNFSQVLTYGGSYTITTNQPRYLNVYEDGVVFFKTINLTGDRLLPELRLRGGNAYWRVVGESNAYTDQYDNTVNGSDASVVGTDWGPNSSSDLTINHGDVNFDGKVNIQDLALVGGNFGLTSADAYEAWLQ